MVGSTVVHTGDGTDIATQALRDAMERHKSGAVLRRRSLTAAVDPCGDPYVYKHSAVACDEQRSYVLRDCL